MSTNTHHFLFGFGLLLLAACSGTDSVTPADSETAASSPAALNTAQSEYLFFASDAHLPSTGIGNLQELVTWATGLGVPSCELAALVGDSTIENSDDMATLRGTLSGVSTINNPVFTQGNHDDLGVVGDGPVAVSGNDNYQVFAISWDNFQSYYADSLNNPLRTYLEATDFTIARNKAQIVLTHYPLHSKQFTDPRNPANDWNTEAENILSVLQEFGKHMDIIVLWGHDHNHTDQDGGIPMIAKPGDNVTIRETNRTLNFAYLNAGYITPIVDSANRKPAATVVGMDRRGIEITRRNDDESITKASYTRRRRVALKARYNNLYTCADLNDNRNGALYADRSAIGAWETFHPEDLGGGHIALWAHANARYVVAENNGTSRAVARSTEIGYDGNGVSWEIFDLRSFFGGRYSFRSHTNNKHLRYDTFIPESVETGPGSHFYMEDAP